MASNKSLLEIYAERIVGMTTGVLVDRNGWDAIRTDQALIYRGESAYRDGPVDAVLGQLKRELSATREQLAGAQRAFQNANATINALKKQPSLYGSVLKLTKSGAVAIVVAGKRVEVTKPATMDLKAGDTVRVTGDTMQILDKVEDADPTGEIVALKSISGTVGEIERSGASRAVVVPMKAEAGDRVVLDDSGTIALAVLEPEAGARVFGESTNVSWDDIGGLETAKAHLREAIEGPFKQRDVFARFRKKPTRGVLLYGPAGTGKTLLGKAAATAIAELHGAEAKGGFFYVKGPELLNMYVGNTEANIRKMFDGARRHEKKHGFPAVIFIDEADAILGSRGQRGFGMEKTIVPQFLAEMDGLDATGAIVLLATNRPSSLDPAIVRDGRIDRRIHVTRPGRRDSLAIAKIALRGKPADDSADMAEAVVSGVFHGGLVVAKVVYEESGQKLHEHLLLQHTVSGAMLTGVVERATSAAIARGAERIERADVDAAVVMTFNESIDVNHSEELMDLCGGFLPDVTDVRKGVRIHALPKESVAA